LLAALQDKKAAEPQAVEAEAKTAGAADASTTADAAASDDS
jgi:hypothetical protein